MFMLSFLFGLLLLVVAVVLWVLLRTYQHIPTKELKRLARRGDHVAELLYRAASFNGSLRLLLGGGSLLFAVLAFANLSSALGFFWAVVVVLVVVGLGYVLLVPSGELKRSSLWLAQKAAPGIGWLLERVQPVTSALVRFAERFRHVSVHTGLYEKEDIVELLERQKNQPDSRIAPDEIDLLAHALTFGDKQVGDAMVPKRAVKSVSADESIGPVLMSDLHSSGHSRFPVYGEKHDDIVGVLYLRRLVNKAHTGKVADVMSKKITYVHEDFSLHRTLQAFLKTKQHLFLVVNSFEELVGIITVEDIIEQMIGKHIIDEFDQYDDLRAVAAAAAKKDHGTKDHAEDKIPTPPTAEDTEVVK